MGPPTGQPANAQPRQPSISHQYLSRDQARSTVRAYDVTLADRAAAYRANRLLVRRWIQLTPPPALDSGLNAGPLRLGRLRRSAVTRYSPSLVSCSRIIRAESSEMKRDASPPGSLRIFLARGHPIIATVDPVWIPRRVVTWCSLQHNDSRSLGPGTTSIGRSHQRRRTSGSPLRDRGHSRDGCGNRPGSRCSSR